MTPISESHSASPTNDHDKLLWFSTGVSPKDLLDAVNYKPIRQYTVTGYVRKMSIRKDKVLGKKIEINGKQLVLFKYNNRVYASVEKCPHQGGALDLGDIEDINGDVCVTCPWHKWEFSLVNGNCHMSQNLQLPIFPVKQVQETIYIGFPSIDESSFLNFDD